VRYHFGSLTAEGRFPRVEGFPATGFGQRRRHLDRALFEAAAATPGVTAYSGRLVSAPLFERGHVAGLIVDDQPRRASLVVAADGSNSLIRRALELEAPARRKRFGMRAHFRLAPGQAQPQWVDVFMGEGLELYVTPLPGREFGVAALSDIQPLGESAERTFLRWALGQPELAARLEGAQQVSELMGASPLERRAGAGFARGVVLLGDAAGSTDPITGGGMAQALMTAELLGGYIATHLHAHSNAGQEWLAAFDRERRDMLRKYRALTQMTLWLADHRRLAQGAVLSLRFAPALFSYLLGICGGIASTRARRWEKVDSPRGA
jgi:2-polyprenyl-6-methoxyphenol hydroxylase-like FAD-dependent oxidoreductase